LFFQENGNDVKAEVKQEEEAESAPVAFVCSAEHLDKLAENLTAVENWNKLIPKLGMTEDGLKKIWEEKKATAKKGNWKCFFA
jgi:hypothetical protein